MDTLNFDPELDAIFEPDLYAREERLVRSDKNAVLFEVGTDNFKRLHADYSEFCRLLGVKPVPIVVTNHPRPSIAHNLRGTELRLSIGLMGEDGTPAENMSYEELLAGIALATTQRAFKDDNFKNFWVKPSAVSTPVSLIVSAVAQDCLPGVAATVLTMTASWVTTFFATRRFMTSHTHNVDDIAVVLSSPEHFKGAVEKLHQAQTAYDENLSRLHPSRPHKWVNERMVPATKADERASRAARILEERALRDGVNER